MGKFFVAGVFLGAAATFAIMHFLTPKGLAGRALELKIHQECETARAEATRIAKEAAKADLDKKLAELADEHDPL